MTLKQNNPLFEHKIAKQIIVELITFIIQVVGTENNFDNIIAEAIKQYKKNMQEPIDEIKNLNKTVEHGLSAIL